MALAIDVAVKANRPDAWRGELSRENMVKGAIYAVLMAEGYTQERAMAETERLFLIVMQQQEY
jgi:type I restriction enzyme R subunit